MRSVSTGCVRLACCLLACLGGLIGGSLAAAQEPAVSSPCVPEGLPPNLSLPAAVYWALERNPELAALRAQHGIAAAGIVIAQTYPFNPAWEGKVLPDTGPQSAGITNSVYQEHKILIDVETRGQGKYRRQGATAALSRTDWEIAFQEGNLAIRVVRAFDTILYRQQKLALIEETVRLNEQALAQVRILVEQGRLRAPDLILLRSEVQDAGASRGPGRTALATAQQDLRRALGLIGVDATVHGALADTVPEMPEPSALVRRALERRADLHARRAALTEAEAKWRLEIANRYGNTNVGPMYELDPTRVSYIGFQITLPLPVCNTHRGEIMQRQAEREQVALQVRQLEVLVQQDVQAALTRLAEARSWVETYRSKVLPDLRSGLEGMEKLFAQAEPGVDVVRVLDVRRKLLKARDGYLDALYELSQAHADLALAAGDLTLILPSCPPAETVSPSPTTTNR